MSKLVPNKSEILEKLIPLQDEPDLESAFFGFPTLSKQLVDFILHPSTPSPFTIGLHGEWGAGKTSLAKRVYNVVASKEIPYTKVVWFDAWEYERLDAASALMYTIAYAYKEKDRNEEFKKKISLFKRVMNIIRPISPYLQTGLMAGTGINFPFAELAHFQYESIIEGLQPDSKSDMNTISRELKKMVGEGRLVVFVDDLDRCAIDSVLEILGAIKLFLNAPGVIFVIAVDMSKIERAWELRYARFGEDKEKITREEGKDHIEKIFQLRLSLPPKTRPQMESFITALASTLPTEQSEILIKSCPDNPRKIKRFLNYFFFLLSTNKWSERKFQECFRPMFLWAVCKIIFRESSIYCETRGELTASNGNHCNSTSSIS